MLMAVHVDDIDWSELGDDAVSVAAELERRAEAVLATLDARLAALVEIERRSAAMVVAQQHWGSRRRGSSGGWSTRRVAGRRRPRRA